MQLGEFDRKKPVPTFSSDSDSGPCQSRMYDPDVKALSPSMECQETVVLQKENCEARWRFGA